MVTPHAEQPTRREFVNEPWPVVGSLALAGLALGGSATGHQDDLVTFNVVKHGAKGDGKSKDTTAIQATIDACHRQGGGTVLFPPGTFLSGSLHLTSGVALHLDHAATLLASKDQADFDTYEKLEFKNAADHETSFFHHALIWAEDAERIAITGSGRVNGNRKKRGGPKIIALKRCKFLAIHDITILDSPNYCISLLGTDYVNINGVTILNGYSDGIDPDCCRHIRISNCHIECWDDAICPKTSFSLGQRRSTENVTITNCTLASNCNAFKLGTESGGDFRNISVNNCVIFARPQMRPPISGISLLSVDGANIDGVTINNICMTDVRCPVFLRLGNRGRDMEKPTPGTLKNVILSHIVANGAEEPCTLSGMPHHPIESVTMINMRITCKGGGTAEQSQVEVAEHISKYPSAGMFGNLPAYGVYCRHVRNLNLSTIHLGCASSDSRHAVMCDDVSRLLVDSLGGEQAKNGQALLHFREVRDATAPRPGARLPRRLAGGRHPETPYSSHRSGRRSCSGPPHSSSAASAGPAWGS